MAAGAPSARTVAIGLPRCALAWATVAGRPSWSWRAGEMSGRRSTRAMRTEPIPSQARNVARTLGEAARTGPKARRPTGPPGLRGRARERARGPRLDRAPPAAERRRRLLLGELEQVATGEDRAVALVERREGGEQRLATGGREHERLGRRVLAASAALGL